MSSRRASSPSPSPRRRTPPLRLTPPPPLPRPLRRSPDSCVVERRYPLRSTRADLTPKPRGRTLELAPPPAQSRPYEGSNSSHSTRRYPVRSTRVAATPNLRGRALTPAPPSAQPRRSGPPTPPPTSVPPSSAPRSPPPSVPPTPPPPSSSNAPLHAVQEQGVYQSAIGEDGKLIKIQIEELHAALDTLGVSSAERNKTIDDLLKKCQTVYEETLKYQKDRCMSLVKAITILDAEHDEICSILGETNGFAEDFLESASLSCIHGSLTASLRRLNVLKKQRLINLQKMQTKIIDLWDYLGVTLDQQKEYRYIMRNCVARLDDVKDRNALSPDLLGKVNAELKRLEGLMIKEVTKKFDVLSDNLHQTHLSGDKDYELNFTVIDVKDGRIDPFFADTVLEELIMKSKKDILQRAEILDLTEAAWNSRRHSEAKMKSLVDALSVWEEKNDRSFVYDKENLTTQLLKPQSHKDDDLSDAIALSGEKPSPSRSDCWEAEFEDSESDNPSEDPDFSASESEEE